ncbi:transcriptional regulator [Aliishimia ponticola]|uniref:Transcriptional regulator n=2 Tax=Aliishimia ponticola TaxID=2499833 RepID=A0A4S4NFA8_9RHOB|nr:helix-turn-helix domain-containing protein [Aliishimia ponticola]THH37485.1 transcriptional regulator [Aliishimia ponticola]
MDGSDCPDCSRINEVLSRIGDRWSMLIVISLDYAEVMRFNELKRHLGISQRMLSLTLRDLERDGLVRRTYYPTIPPKVEYALTPLGKSFCAPVRAMGEWALKNLPNIDAARAKFDAEAARTVEPV